MKMTTIAYILIAIIAINYLISLIMTFLGVEVQFYGSYLLWVFAIVLFWGFLPEPENYFS
jgi:hypothetical protein